jgi:hypothetical protein
MIEWIIRRSVANRFLVMMGALFLSIWGTWTIINTPVDALPDLSDVQVIIKTSYPGQAPQIVENQVTYPLTTTMLSVPGAKTVRGFSQFGDSYVYVIFEDGTDLYWARSRVLEYLLRQKEAGRIRRGDVVIETVAREYLTPLKNAGVDTLILGCTHYPLLTDVIGDVMGPGVELVSAGEESAFELKRMLKARELRADERRRGETEFYVSDRVEDFERTASLFLQEDLRHTARRIDIERY